MTNEIIFATTVIINFGFVLFASKRSQEFLFAAVAVDLVLISVFGAKLISIFGFVTNTGNIFYAGVFLATHMLIENYGKEEGYRTIRIGAFAILLFLLMAQFTFDLTGYAGTAEVNNAIDRLFRNIPRVGIASVFAFIIAQYVNIWFYSLLKNKTRDKKLWLRDNASNLLGQFIDSMLFFSIAFIGTVPNTVLAQIMMGGFMAKVAVGAVGTLFLYASRRKYF